MVVYVDDFVLIAPPNIEDEIWSELDKHILFKDPKEELNRFLGVYHHISYGKDGLMTMRREGIKYLMAVVKRYMQEAGIQSLAYAPSPSLDDKTDEANSAPGLFAASASSHLMSILYIARLCRGGRGYCHEFPRPACSAWQVDIK